MAARISEDPELFTQLTTGLYRGETDRMTSWRTRLDQTTNWAVVLVAAILTWAFSSPDNPHYVILIGVFGATGFLLMEAHRYREYDAWRNRVRTLQATVFADALSSTTSPGERDWRVRLSEKLRTPELEVSAVQAVIHRLRRSYFWLLLVLLLAWITRITVFETGETWRETASIYVLPGEVVAGTVVVFYAVVAGVVLVSAFEDRTQEFHQ